jgi:hypothetical protein
VLALGGSVAARAGGITAEVLEVAGLEQLRRNAAQARGRIVFFNRPMDRSLFSTFQAYGGAVDQRVRGAAEAARAAPWQCWCAPSPPLWMIIRTPASPSMSRTCLRFPPQQSARRAPIG